MGAQALNCKAGRGLKSVETWLIVLLIYISGVALGYPLGQYSVRKHADIQISEIRAAYAEANEAKAALLQRCIYIPERDQ